MHSPLRTLSALATLLSLLVPAAVCRAEGEISFNHDIRPILSNRCFKCHGPDLKKGGLDLREREGALKELKSGAHAIIPGNAAASRLIERVSHPDPASRMPPKGEPLSAEQIAKLRAWIDQGAKYEPHWSYVKPVRPALPGVMRQAWPRNAIDYFVLARLEREGLHPSPEADRAALLRRVSLDLTGLPPTLAEVDAFLADRGSDAYDKVVDRLLASPHYGEHQARFWLDEARYADTNGYEKDERRTIWPYRDWVINAFNRDMPFDQFTIEQLAGDLLPGATKEQRIATGFHRNTMVNTEGGTDDEEFRVAAIVDRVNTTMEVWMGSTFACAQCHNHKFDPFTQKEYYSLLAFLNGTADRGKTNDPVLPLPTPREATLLKEINAETVREATPLITPTPWLVLDQLPTIAKNLDALKKRQAAVRPLSTLVLRELPKPRPTSIMIRGNFRNLGDPVTPGVPAVLHPLSADQPLDRLTLARWLVSPDNPLIGRVTMNRIWARYFGRGLVETSEEFGAQGDLPTHPDLLDWLATELVAQNWSLKKLHRAIVMSATYRQASRVSPELAERDPFNRLYARGPRFRLDAEMVRDNALAISGLLQRKVGGPSVFPYQPEGVWFNPYSSDKWVTSTNGDQYRRGVYTFWRRTAPYAAFMAFDAPSRETFCERRPRTNTPLQALATLNDKGFVECAQALARRMMTEVQGPDRAHAIHGFRLCVARQPTIDEVDHLLRLYWVTLEQFKNDPTAAQSLAGVRSAELAAWTVVANVLLNLDETITKG